VREGAGLTILRGGRVVSTAREGAGSKCASLTVLRGGRILSARGGGSHNSQRGARSQCARGRVVSAVRESCSCKRGRVLSTRGGGF
jgi:hypothetical protein